MIFTTDTVKSDNYNIVVPFYVYAALSFLLSTLLLFLSARNFTAHYFQPMTLAITHAMALGWGTMIILGASHQLVPVLTAGKLYSQRLACLSFFLAGGGIPLLVFSFSHFRFGTGAILGGILVNAAVLAFLLNLVCSIIRTGKGNVEAIFVLTAGAWLLVTTGLGLLLVINFNHPFLGKASLHFLSLHAHTGIVGWFFMMIVGVGSRLIPMFLISKYQDVRKLWFIYLLINLGLASFVLVFLASPAPAGFVLPLSLLGTAGVLFGRYCLQAYRRRLRKSLDEPMKTSLLSVVMMILPFALMIGLLVFFGSSPHGTRMVLAYGFSIFFGWLTAIILGMSFKTLPFIVWNRVYQGKYGNRIPSPKDLFSGKVFNLMALSYLLGFTLFGTGIFLDSLPFLQTATVLLGATAILYNWNIIKLVLHKPLTR
ncbi:MAG: cytochrome C oxidase subunit I [Flavisolibacter sp.]